MFADIDFEEVRQTLEKLWHTHNTSNPNEITSINPDLSLIDDFVTQQIKYLPSPQPLEGGFLKREQDALLVTVKPFPDESRVGQYLLNASWFNWQAGVILFHGDGHHLRQVTILHENKKLDFLPPAKYNGQLIPSNTLPNSVDITYQETAA